MRTVNNKGFFLFILTFIILTDISVFIDMPLLRWFLGFLLLTIIPGFLILHTLKLNKLGLTEKIVLSVGLSVAFSMFFGILINLVYPFFGYATPLSTNSLLISFNVILFILTIIAYVRNQNTFSINWAELNLDTRNKVFLIIPVIFPLLSIIGMRKLNSTGNNTILLLLLTFIPAYIILIVAMRRRVSERVYPAVIFLIGIAIVLLLGLRSNHVIGRDTHREYFLFQITSSNQYWQIIDKTPLDSSLSITLLPTIYQSILNLDPEFLFKILYPVLLSISPLVVFIISKKYLGSHYSFLTSLFFISQIGFIRTTATSRINLAVLFFILSIMVLFHNDITGTAKRALFIIFSASSIISHYSSSYIFFFLLLITWLGVEIFCMTVSRKERKALSVFFNRKRITISMVVLFLAILFFWYSQVIGTAFSSGIGFIKLSFISLHELFIIESRAQQIPEAFGNGSTISLISVKVKFLFNWLTIILVVIGVLSTSIMYRKMVSIADLEYKLSFLRSKIDVEYFMLSLVCSTIMVSAIVIPYISNAYGMDRVYFQIIGISAMFFIIGGIIIAKFLKLRPQWIILIILIPFFLGNVGMVDQLFNRPILLLNSEGAEYDQYYIHDQESYAAKWLKTYGELNTIRINAEGTGADWLMSQGGLSSEVHVSSILQRNKSIDGYIYLTYYNVVNEEFLDVQYNKAEYQHQFIKRNKIYTSGGSEVWK